VELEQRHSTTDYCIESSTREVNTTLQSSYMTVTYFLLMKSLHLPL
jgi:hypothetical protein